MKRYLQDKNNKMKLHLDKNATLLTVAFLLTITTCIFSVLCLTAVPMPFFRKYFALFSWGVCALLIVLFLLCLRWLTKGKDTLFRTLFGGLFLLAFCVILLYIMLKTNFFDVIKSKKSLEEYLSKTGIWMPIFYVLLQFLQVVVLPIPSTVSTLAGVALFGPFQALVYSFIGIMLGSITAFFIGRKIGYKAVAWIVGKDTLSKWQNKLKGKDNLLLTLMFVLPVFPDDVLCFVAGLSSMSNVYFLCMLTIARILGIATTCYSLKFIPFDTVWGLTIWAMFFLAVVIGFVIVYRHADEIQAWLTKRKAAGKRKK